jgi:hypothetical protein
MAFGTNSRELANIMAQEDHLPRMKAEHPEVADRRGRFGLGQGFGASWSVRRAVRADCWRRWVCDFDLHLDPVRMAVWHRRDLFALVHDTFR